MADEFSDRDRKLFDDTVAVGRLTHMLHCGQKPTAAVLRTSRSPIASSTATKTIEGQVPR